MNGMTLQKSIYLAASPERVWAFLTDPEKLAKWFHRPPAALEAGGHYEIAGQDGGRMMWGEVLAARPPEYLEYTFEIAPLQGTRTVVAWTLEPVAGGTRLSLEHSGLPEGEAAFGLILALDEGWDTHLGQLRLHAPDVELEKSA